MYVSTFMIKWLSFSTTSCMYRSTMYLAILCIIMICQSAHSQFALKEPLGLLQLIIWYYLWVNALIFCKQLITVMWQMMISWYKLSQYTWIPAKWQVQSGICHYNNMHMLAKKLKRIFGWWAGWISIMITQYQESIIMDSWLYNMIYVD